MKALMVLPVVGLAAIGLQAQGPPGGGRGPAAGQTVEKIRELKPNLHMITGGGANTLVRVTPEGLIVVDTKNPGDQNYARVMEEVASVSKLPVKFVFNTHHHPDHVGTNQRFIDAGAQIIGLEALKTHMASDPRTKEIPGPPTMTFAKDYVLKLGGAEVRAHSFGRAGIETWGDPFDPTRAADAYNSWKGSLGAREATPAPGFTQLPGFNAPLVRSAREDEG